MSLYPGLKHLGFYEAEFVKTRRELFCLFIFWLNFRQICDNSPALAFVFDRCGASSEHCNDQTQKSVTFSSAPRNWLKRATE
jgi:hypothetical protein